MMQIFLQSIEEHLAGVFFQKGRSKITLIIHKIKGQLGRLTTLSKRKDLLNLVPLSLGSFYRKRRINLSPMEFKNKISSVSILKAEKNNNEEITDS